MPSLSKHSRNYLTRYITQKCLEWLFGKFCFIEIDSISIIQYSDNIPNLSVLSLNCSIWCYISLLIKTEGTRNKVYLPIRFGYQYYYVEAKNKTKRTMSEVGRYSVSPKSEKFTLQPKVSHTIRPTNNHPNIPTILDHHTELTTSWLFCLSANLSFRLFDCPDWLNGESTIRRTSRQPSNNSGWIFVVLEGGGGAQNIRNT